jgi:hypothetical protein
MSTPTPNHLQPNMPAQRVADGASQAASSLASNPRGNELYLLILGAFLPGVLGGLESLLRFAAQNEDGTTFFPPSLAAAGIALFLPLALADNPWLNVPWKRVV